MGVADLRLELLYPGPAGSERCLGAAGNFLAQHEGRGEVLERASFGGERLLFCEFRQVLIAGCATIIKPWRARRDSNPRPTA